MQFQMVVIVRRVLLLMLVIVFMIMLQVATMMSGELIDVSVGTPVHDIELGPHDPLPGYLGGSKFEPFQVEARHVLADRLKIYPQVQQRPHEHIAAHAGKSIQIEYSFHAAGSLPRPLTASLLIISA